MSAQATIAPKVVGLIAGGRQFPVLVAQGVKAAGHRLVVAGFAGHTNAEVYPPGRHPPRTEIGPAGQAP